MAKLPTIDTYGRYSSGNYGAHCLRVDFENLTLWYSYNTIIAYHFYGEGSDGLTVRQNDWSTTTGKHLNAIDGGDKKRRISGNEFEKKLADILKKLGLSN